MLEYASTISLYSQQWLYVKAAPIGDAKQATHLRTNIRICRKLLAAYPSLLALPSNLEDSTQSSTFFLIYRKDAAKGEGNRVLKKLGCARLWEPPESEAEQGVPFSLFHEAVRFALRCQLNQRQWLVAGQYMIKDALSGRHSGAPLAAIKLNCWINETNTLSLAVEGLVCKLVPVKWDSLNRHHYMIDGKVAAVPDSADAIPTMSKTPPPSQVGLSTEKDYRDYWQEVHGCTLPKKIEGYITVTFGLWRRTYPSCCLCAQELTIMNSQTKLKQEEIIRSLLTELNGAVFAGQPITFSENVIPRPVDVSWQSIDQKAVAHSLPDKPNGNQQKRKLLVPKFAKRRPSTATFTVPLSSVSPAETKEPLPPTESIVMPVKKPPLLIPTFMKPTPLPSRSNQRPGVDAPKKKPSASTRNQIKPIPSSLPPTPLLTKAPSPIRPDPKRKDSNPKENSPIGKRKRGSEKKTSKSSTEPPASPSVKEPAPKRPKKQAKVVDLATINFKDLVQTQKLATLSVPVLQAYCRQNNVGSVPRKKDDLLKVVSKHINQG